jgi:hypothetical protein
MGTPLKILQVGFTRQLRQYLLLTTATGGRVNFFELRKFLGKQRKMLYNLTPKEGTITQSINRLVYKMDAFEYILISTPSIMFA